MTNERILIIHGWSDCSGSFVDMKRALVARRVAEADDIFFVDYESRDDSLTLPEISRALQNRLLQLRLIGPSPQDCPPLNIIVHSTGGLVVRHWLQTYYSERAWCPVRRIVMLAPANFGSPLAHRGKSFLGSLVKGRWKVGDFLEVGQQILNDL